MDSILVDKIKYKDLQVAIFCVEITKIEENNLIDQTLFLIKQVLDSADPIYQVLLLDLSICSNFDYCLYNNNMVKKLRNRQLESDTDHENDQQSSLLTYDTANFPFIRKFLSKKFSTDAIQKREKVLRFKRRLSSGQIKNILHNSPFQCPVCLELMISPVLMICGHSYCYRCLESNAAYNQKCCLCRQQQKGQAAIPFKQAQLIIENFLFADTQQYMRYLCRMTDSSEWAKRRKMVNWKKGLVVDFQDRCNVWRRGVIVNSSQADMVEIKTNIKGMDFFEKVQRNSRRLAPFTFFTRGRYLEDFPTTLPQNDTAQREIQKLEYRPQWNDDSNFNFPEENSQPISEAIQQFYQEVPLQLFNSYLNEIQSILNFD